MSKKVVLKDSSPLLMCIITPSTSLDKDIFQKRKPEVYWVDNLHFVIHIIH